MKKLVSLVIVMALVLSLAVGAAAQTVGAAATDKGSITISNASKGETYSIYKLFGATVSAATDKDGNSQSISYTGDIPDDLENYFEKDDKGNITATAAAKSGEALSEEAVTALKTWASSKTATASDVSDGSALTFAGLDYGYYVITSSQGNTQITVDSTKPNVTVVDKNSTDPGDGFKKDVDNDNISIGDNVTYTVEFLTANYSGQGVSAKQIISYTIKDTLPNFLTDVTVTRITIGGADYTVNSAVPQFDDNGEITIPWATSTGEDENKVWTSLYNNGAKVIITYTAVVTDEILNTAGEGVNEVSLKWTTTDGTEKGPEGENPQVSVKSYAIAIKKVDQSGNALAGATFQLPFYVNVPASGNVYTYAYENLPTTLPDGKTANDYTNIITTDNSGLIVIKGLKAASYSFTETVAPAGYNKLTSAVVINMITKNDEGEDVVIAGSQNHTFYLDANGERVQAPGDGVKTVNFTTPVDAVSTVVVNKTGTELPSTGGVGTTIFYALGSLMFIGALVLLVTNKRMKAE